MESFVDTKLVLLLDTHHFEGSPKVLVDVTLANNVNESPTSKIVVLILYRMHFHYNISFVFVLVIRFVSYKRQDIHHHYHHWRLRIDQRFLCFLVLKNSEVVPSVYL